MDVSLIQFPKLSFLTTAFEVIQFPRHSSGEKPINLLVTNSFYLNRKHTVFLQFKNKIMKIRFGYKNNSIHPAIILF